MNRKDRYFPDESGGLFACRMLMNMLILVTFPVACGLYMKKPPVALLFSGMEMLLVVIIMEVIQREMPQGIRHLHAGASAGIASNLCRSAVLCISASRCCRGSNAGHVL